MNFATQTAVYTGESAGPHPPLSLEDLAPHFPQLEILECLGRGGMGVVYRARQKSLNRLVALKLLAPERVEVAEFAERFKKEAEALAGLSHPNIVTVYDFGETSGLFYLLMEFVDGVNLRQAMQAGRFTPEQALAIVPPICDALQYAHEHGIVHRDIKPENLLLDKTGQMKIADFGIARMLGRDTANADLADSQPAGTPRYMAPEQLANPRAVDHRVDIYSLGVVIYEMLTGELPTSKLEPPSQKVHVDVRLDGIVLRALQQRPELRFHTALDLKTHLELVSASTGVTERPAADLRLRRRWRPVVMASAGLILILAGAWIAARSLLPREYFAKVTMQLRPDDQLQLFSVPSVEDPQFFLTQFQVLRKTEILYPVIQQLDLGAALSKSGQPLQLKESFAQLVESLETRWIRNTSLVEVGVYNRDPELAAKIANTIADVWCSKRLQDIQNTRTTGVRQIEEEVTKQRKLIEELSLAMEQIRQREGIVDPEPDRLNVSDAAPKGTGDHSPYAETKVRYLHSKRLLEEAERRLSAARVDQGIDRDPCVIWERAEPAPAPSSLSFLRLWHRLIDRLQRSTN